MTNDDKREVLEEVIEKMDECAELLRSLCDPRIDAYCLAAFEGRDRGWLGHFERDVIEEVLKALDDGDPFAPLDDDEDDD